MSREARLLVHYARSLYAYLRRPLTFEECRRDVEHRLATREESFLDVFERGIAGNVASPYRRLLEHAGAEPGDWSPSSAPRASRGRSDASTTRASTSPSTSSTAGGRSRGARSSSRCARATSTTLSAAGTTGRRPAARVARARPILVDLGMTEHEARYLAVVAAAFDVGAGPMGIWFPLPPGVAALKALLVRAKLGVAAERWFTQTRLSLPSRSAAMTLTTVAVSRLARVPLPFPRSTSPDQADRVAAWLAGKRSAGTPALFSSTPSSGTRICLAAAERGLDIAGTTFWFGGEPYTAGKAKVIRSAGCRAFSNYYFTEIGQLGLACAAPEEVDEVHLALDTVAAIERPPRRASGLGVEALYYTSLLPVSPKLALNVESGDYGVLTERRCGCLLDDLGFRAHLHGILSYEKLTTEGMNLLGGDLVELVENMLPARFGGSPTDYQFVEEEADGGLTKVRLVVSPRVGGLDEEELVRAVLETLAAGAGAER